MALPKNKLSYPIIIDEIQKGLIAFCEEHPHPQAIVASQDARPRRHG